MKLTELSKIQYLTVAVMVLLTILAFGKANAQQCNIVYVKSGGATSGTAGTKSNPANLSYGISLANVTNNQVYLAAGTYIAYSAVIIKQWNSHHNLPRQLKCGILSEQIGGHVLHELIQF